MISLYCSQSFYRFVLACIFHKMPTASSFRFAPKLKQTLTCLLSATNFPVTTDGFYSLSRTEEADAPTPTFSARFRLSRFN